MVLKLLPAEHSDMQELVKVVYAANSDPRDPFVDLCLPGLGAWSSATHEQGVQEVTKRYLAKWKGSKTQTWLKVVDDETGQIISASRWEVFDHNPYADGLPHIDAEWLPAGSRLREYAEWLINERMGQAAARCGRPHVWLDICATRPDQRRRGAAGLSLQWGVEKAEELDVEAFIEASIDGSQLYEKFGFVTELIMDWKKDDAEVDAEWKKIADEYPLRYCWMEREPKSKRV